MLNLRNHFIDEQEQEQCGFILIILLEFKLEYYQNLIKPYACQYNVKSKIYSCLSL